MPVKTSFSGFPRDSFQLFRDLADPEKNQRLWFDAHRWRYEENIVGKMKELLTALKPFALKLNPQFECSGKTNGNFSRINRDIRFSKDKAPYKLNYYLYLFDKRRARDADGRLYVGVNGEGLTVGFSVYGEWRRKTGNVLSVVLRKHVEQERSLLDNYVQRRHIDRNYESYWYSIVDKAWSQHRGLPRSDEHWENLQGWVVRRKIKPRAAGAPGVLKEIMAIFTELYPLYIFVASADRQWARKFRQFSR